MKRWQPARSECLKLKKKMERVNHDIGLDLRLYWNQELFSRTIRSGIAQAITSISALSSFKATVADEITEQLIDLYARRAKASEQKDWERVRRLDVEMKRNVLPFYGK